MTHPHLEMRGNVFWFRRKIPLELLPAYGGKKEIRHSLHTRDRNEAKRFARLRSVVLDGEFEHKRRDLQPAPFSIPDFQEVDLSDEEIRRICLLWQRLVLEADDYNRVEGFKFIDYEEVSENVTDNEPALRQALARGQFDVIEHSLNSFLHLCCIRVDKNSQNYRRLQYQFLQTLIETGEFQKKRQNGEVLRTDAVVSSEQVFHLNSTDVKKDFFSIDDLFNIWEGQVLNRPASTLSAFSTAKKQFKNFVGENKSVPDIDRKSIVAFRDKLLNEDKLNFKTVETKLALLSAMFQAAIDSEKLEFNPCFRVKVKRPKVPPVSRVPYDVVDIKLIFSILSNMGPVPKGGKGAAALWLPSLALYSGARLEELAQLFIEDVVEDPQHGWYLNIIDIPYEDEGGDEPQKSVKTLSSRRRVPIHLALIKAGFLRYVERCKREGHSRLFPELKPDCKGKWSGNWSKWWGNFCRKKIGITSKLKVFHSFRHNFKDACREGDIEEAVHDALTGHSGVGVGRKYGGKYPIAPLFKAIHEVSYPGFVLPVIEP